MRATEPGQAREQLAARLRALRHRAGLSQKVASKAAHVSEQTWRRWETGRNTPFPTRLPAIASAVNASIEELYCEEGSAVLAVHVSPETLERIRCEGRPAVDEVSARLTRRILDEVSRLRPMRDDVPLGCDVRVSTRRRRTRVEVLALDRSRLNELRRASRAERKRIS